MLKAMASSNASMSGLALRSSVDEGEESQPSQLGMPPSKDNASSSNTRHGTKSCASTTGLGSKRLKFQHENEDTVSGARASVVKRISAGSTSAVSGAISPARRPRLCEANEAVETNKIMLTVENWAELHEFDE